MATKIKFHPDVDKDLQEARKYYNSQQNGLGAEFSSKVKHRIAMILENPDIYFIVCPPNIRGAKVEKFTDYSIIYEQASEQSINIYAVFSWRRDPEELLERFPKH